MPLHHLWKHICFSICLSLTVSANPKEDFDPVISKKIIPASESESSTQCFYFQNFMIKQYDSGGKGTDGLSIIHFSSPQPSCTKEKLPNEIEIKNWTGYFDGVRNGFLFSSGEDGWNGSIPFLVAKLSDGKVVLESAATDNPTSNRPLPGLSRLLKMTLKKNRLELKYTLAAKLPCTTRDDVNSCWSKATMKYSFLSPQPADCKKDFRLYIENKVRSHCKISKKKDCLKTMISQTSRQWENSDLMVGVPVVIDDLNNPEIKDNGNAKYCWPAD